MAALAQFIISAEKAGQSTRGARAGVAALKYGLIIAKPKGRQLALLVVQKKKQRSDPSPELGRERSEIHKERAK